MAVVDALATVALTVVIPPFLIVLVTVLVLASLGKSLGLRQKYVQFLLKVFEASQWRVVSGVQDIPGACLTCAEDSGTLRTGRGAAFVSCHGQQWPQFPVLAEGKDIKVVSNYGFGNLPWRPERSAAQVGRKGVDERHPQS
ncbi:hypothetical protein E2C01_053618 [Portunus trituberculatus]|uniref:Uncharacterized protein n=1 Tax=Portunus trituberculatus TaxID=210409 RepID=A0A5B7GSS4_PORTR|nr:hypothetical protein [Portunus trituberculatus]